MERIFSVVAFTVITFLLHAQQPNWGWGPAITTSLSGTTLTCSAFDPVLSTTKTTTINSVDDFINNEGVVAWVTPGGTVGGVTYDINQGSFEQTTFSNNSGNIIQNEGGVISFVSSAGTVGGAVYDPAQESWEYTTFSNNSGNTVINRDGVIAFVSSAGTVGGAVYDPAQESWEYTTFSNNSGNTVINRDGVIAFVSSAGTVGGAIYDPAQQSWEYTTFSNNSGNSIVNQNGVIAFISSAGTVGGAAYDHNGQSWDYTTFSNSSNNTNLSISDGTIIWNSSSGTSKYGYDNGNWSSNVNTDLSCKVFAVNAEDTKHIAYLWCLTIGANSYSYSCGDGHTVTSRWAWKQYASGGSYGPSLAIFNSSSNSSCSASLNFAVTNVPGISAADFSVFPNPAYCHDALRLSLSEKAQAVRITELNGKIVYENQFSPVSGNVSLELDGVTLSAGVYFVEIYFENGAKSVKKFLVHNKG